MMRRPSASTSDGVLRRNAPVLFPKFSTTEPGRPRSRHPVASALPEATSVQELVQRCLLGIDPTMLARIPFSDLQECCAQRWEHPPHTFPELLAKCEISAVSDDLRALWISRRSEYPMNLSSTVNEKSRSSVL